MFSILHVFRAWELDYRECLSPSYGRFSWAVVYETFRPECMFVLAPVLIIPRNQLKEPYFTPHLANRILPVPPVEVLIHEIGEFAGMPFRAFVPLATTIDTESGDHISEICPSRSRAVGSRG